MSNILQKILEQPATVKEVLTDILMLELPLVNVFFVGDPANKQEGWVLVDAGMAHTAQDILHAAEGRFGKGISPQAIILTHGHFDHVGAIMELLEVWNVPVYAHQMELPYLTGKLEYPPADPTVDDGLIAQISPTFPHKSINLGNRVQALPGDGSVPGMAAWQWVQTPGHTPGHISLFRQRDGVLIVGDAFTTWKQEEAESILAKEKDINGPPAYFTMDWRAAQESIRTIVNLKPQIALPSHGLPLRGEELTRQLNRLLEHISREAVPVPQ